MLSILLLLLLLLQSTLSFQVHRHHTYQRTRCERTFTALNVHHICHKTLNIQGCIDFYSLFNYTVSSTFRASSAQCAWLRCNNTSSSNPIIELIEIPKPFHNKVPKPPAPPLTETPLIPSYNHVAFLSPLPLGTYLPSLSSVSSSRFSKELKILQPPTQKQIDREIWEMAYVQGPDLTVVELLYKCATLPDGVGVE
ncbi:hypothetical protein TrVE_jg11845 [Triparma verrucosa]|uniref:Uncharacterized protein n=1 Tax=Triparma verrucosa TaxID=1606542 RepID=A0A9W7B1U3_9STRA|nr:hypothetical protein TrVE_jg11845 [Triparma verrucosa]